MADQNDSENNDRQVVEEYLKLYCIEEILDETINDIVERRPANPYVEMAKLIEAKTMPEIIEVLILPVIAASGVCGVEAVVNTNLGTFRGKSSFPFDIDDDIESVSFRDFEVAQLKIDDALKNVDPTDLSRVDETLLGLADIDPAVITAVSIASARAGCRHRGLPLYKFLSEMASTEPQIPMPAAAVICRTVGEHRRMQTQHVHLYPTSATSIEVALTTLMETTRSIDKEFVGAELAMTVGSSGCSQLSKASMDDMCAVIRDAVASGGHPTKISIDYKGGTLVSIASSGEISYCFDGNLDDATGHAGSEVVESIISQFKENESISIEDPLHVQDMDSLRHLKDRVAETMALIKEENAEELRYNVFGVGGDETCFLQVVADVACKNADEIKILADENVFNAVKIRFDKIGTITGAIAMVKAAREIGWGIIVSSNEDAPETVDTFIADFAVGMGAGQFMGGSLHSAENYEKYNRLVEIRRGDERVPFAGSTFRR